MLTRKFDSAFLTITVVFLLFAPMLNAYWMLFTAALLLPLYVALRFVVTQADYQRQMRS